MPKNEGTDAVPRADGDPGPISSFHVLVASKAPGLDIHDVLSRLGASAT